MILFYKSMKLSIVVRKKLILKRLKNKKTLL